MQKITVALIAYNRPSYLKEALTALENCRGFQQIVDRVVCSVDDAPGQGTRCYHHLKRWEKSRRGILEVVVDGQPHKRGIVGNTVLAMKRAFDLGAENVLMLEDDAVLKPDALLLAEWFCSLEANDVLAFSLAAHGDKGGVRQDEYPASISEYNLITCPFGYVVNKRHWEFLKKIWCNKNYHPCGWSWSMTYAARLHGFKFMAPWLSRCENIGREAGTNETPETWDATQRGMKFSDGTYTGDYRIIRTISDDETRKIDDWMRDEIDQTPAKLYDGWLGFGRPKELDE